MIWIQRFLTKLFSSSFRATLWKSVRPLQKARKSFYELSNLQIILEKTMEEQTASLQSFAKTIEELSSSANEISSVNQSVLKKVDASRSETEAGAETVNELRLVTAIFTSQKKEFNNVLDLMHSVRQATNIINEIVFQTSLLSFNASVEAERAGENGRGFGIVAQEIKNLAESSQKASNEIAKKIELCIDGVDNLVSSLSTGIDSLVEHTEVTYKKFDNIRTNANTLTEAIQEITQGTERQSLAINESLGQLQRFTNLNDRNSRFSVVSVNEITRDLGESLQKISDSTQQSLHISGGKFSPINLFWRRIDRLLIQLKDCSDLKHALEIVTREIPRFTPWTIAHAFVPDDQHSLYSAKIWSELTEQERQSEFYKFSVNLSFKPGEGMPGRALESKEYCFTEYNENLINRPRTKVALALGIKVGVAFPILSRDRRVLAVIEFFSYQNLKLDPNFTDAIDQIGDIIGGKSL